MTEQDTQRSYDDLPEAAVATVLQVPLLLPHGPSEPATPKREQTSRRPTGRHRAPDVGADRSKLTTQPSSGGRSSPSWLRRMNPHLIATARVGLVSAGLVLALFVAGLLALAAWLP
ncbi:MAG: hypothetical protein ABI720_09315 [Actinomycetes bacterium]